MHLSIILTAFIAVLPFMAQGVPLSMDRISASLGARNDPSIEVFPRVVTKAGSSTPPPEQQVLEPVKPTEEPKEYFVLLDKTHPEHVGLVGTKKAAKYLLGVAMSKEYTSDTNKKHFKALAGLFGFTGHYTAEMADKIRKRKGVLCVSIPGSMSIGATSGGPSDSSCPVPDPPAPQHGEAVTPNANVNVDTTHPKEHSNESPKVKPAVLVKVPTMGTTEPVGSPASPVSKVNQR